MYMLMARICKFAPFAGTVLLCAARGAVLLLALSMQGSDGKSNQQEDDQGDYEVGDDGGIHGGLTEAKVLQSG